VSIADTPQKMLGSRAKIAATYIKNASL